MSNVGDVSVGLPQMAKGEQNNPQPKEVLDQLREEPDRELIRPLKPLMPEQGASSEQQERGSFDRESAIFNRDRTVVNRRRLVVAERDAVALSQGAQPPATGATEGPEIKDRVQVRTARGSQESRELQSVSQDRDGRRISDAVDIAARETGSGAVRTKEQNNEPPKEEQPQGVRLELQA